MPWKYEIRSNEDDSLLLEDFGFETESEAELQASMEAKVQNLKGYIIRTTDKYEK